jgi:hypothetical protein
MWGTIMNKYILANPRLSICPVCDGMVSTSAKTCPHCGHPLSPSISIDTKPTNSSLMISSEVADQISRLNARIVDFERTYAQHTRKPRSIRPVVLINSIFVIVWLVIAASAEDMTFVWIAMFFGVGGLIIAPLVHNYNMLRYEEYAALCAERNRLKGNVFPSPSASAQNSRKTRNAQNNCRTTNKSGSGKTLRSNNESEVADDETRKRTFEFTFNFVGRIVAVIVFVVCIRSCFNDWVSSNKQNMNTIIEMEKRHWRDKFK